MEAVVVDSSGTTGCATFGVDWTGATGGCSGATGGLSAGETFVALTGFTSSVSHDVDVVKTGATGCSIVGWLVSASCDAGSTGADCAGADDACLLISSVLSASFRMPVNHSGSSPREPGVVDGTGGCTCVGGAPIGALPVGEGMAGACCIIVTCSGGKA